MTIIFFLLTLMVLVLIHEFGHFLIAKKSGVKVEEFGFGLPPRIFGIKKGETLYSINLLPLGGFVKLYGEEYEEMENKKAIKDKNRTFINKKPWQKTLIVLGGVFGNFLLGWFIFSFLVTQGIPVPTNKVVIEKVSANSPAAKAGLEEGDVISKIILPSHPDKPIILSTADALISQTQQSAGQIIELGINRNSSNFLVRVFIRKTPPKGEGPLGVAITSYVNKSYPWYVAPYYGLTEAFNISYKIISEFAKLFFGFVTFHKQNVDIAGPVGIANLTGQAVKFGRNAYLEFLALLSLNLAIMNVLPFPALDGGRLVFVLYEWVTKKRPNHIIEQYTNLVGFVLLLLLAALVTINDIIKLFKK